jgi:hypothetical protein
MNRSDHDDKEVRVYLVAFFMSLWQVSGQDLPLSVPVGRYQNISCTNHNCLHDFVLQNGEDNATSARWLLVRFAEPIEFILPSLTGVTLTEFDSTSVRYPSANERLVTERTHRARIDRDDRGHFSIRVDFEFNQTSCTLDWRPHPLNQSDNDPTNDGRPCADGSTLGAWRGDHRWRGVIESHESDTLSLDQTFFTKVPPSSGQAVGVYRRVSSSIPRAGQ